MNDNTKPAMRDYKSSLLILISVLLLISASLLYTVFYHFYFKTPVQASPVKQVSKVTAVAIKSSPDSLLKTYAATIKDLDQGFDSTWYNADSLKNSLDTRLSEFYRLRNEIKAVLKDSGLNADLRIARQKILGLQKGIEALRYSNMDVERENKRLNSLLNQLKDDEKVMKQNPLSDGIVNKSTIKNTSTGNVFLLYELRFSAIQMNDDKEQETNKTEQAEKLLGSFRVKNNDIQNSTAEIMVVVLQPDGKVMQNSTWDAGTFETSEGKKIYSGKLSFEYNRGESKKLLFSLTADKFQQGNYMLKIYHNGKLIGKIVKTLS